LPFIAKAGKLNPNFFRDAVFASVRPLTAIVIIGVAAWCVVCSPAGAEDIGCNVHQGPCTALIQASVVSLDIFPKPVTAMRETTFVVTIAGPQPEQPPVIDLGMPAMTMGPNQVKLKRTGEGQYTGTGVIVRCASGKRTWFANVTLPGRGEVRFVFDVVY
jgi:hypothetical protein